MIHYNGNDAWQPRHMPKWSSGGFGTDKATVTWSGSRTKMEAFKRTLEGLQWASMAPFSYEGAVQFPGFPLMFFDTYSDSGGTDSFPEIDLSYVGFRDNAIPTAKGIDSTSFQSANGAGTYTNSDDEAVKVSGTFYYMASRTTWTWFETSPPQLTPRYASVNDAINPFNRVIGYSITDDTGKAVNTIPYAAFVAVFNSLVPSYRISEYTKEDLVPGKLWACSSTIDWLLS